MCSNHAAFLKMRHVASVLSFGLLMIAVCCALPQKSFAEDGGTSVESAAASTDTQLAVRHAYFAYGYTECTDVVQLIMPEPAVWHSGPDDTYPESYSTTMMLCDSDHTVYVLDDGENCDNVTFLSSNTAVLEIENDGRVTLKKTGTARITAVVAADEAYAERIMYLDVRVDRHEGWRDSQWVYYVDRPRDWGLEIDTSDGPQQMILNLRPGASVKYTSENSEVAKVDRNGIVTPLTPGTTQIFFEIDSGGGRYKACRFAQTIKVSGDPVSEDPEQPTGKTEDPEQASGKTDDPEKDEKEEAERKAADEAAAKKLSAKETARLAAERKAAVRISVLKAELANAKALKRPKFKAKALKGHKIKLNWSKVKYADGYILYVKYPGAKKYVKAVKKDATVKSVTHSGLTVGRVYRYKVRAYKVVMGKCYYGPYSKVRKAKVR